MAKKVEEGDNVAVHYTGTLDTGEEFDSSRERDPIRFTVGSGQVIPGFDSAVRGMEVGETQSVRLEPDDAYGQPREDLLVEVPKGKLPDGLDPAVGQALQVEVAPGQQQIARITEVGESEVTLDLNHPLAGRALNFELEVVGVD